MGSTLRVRGRKFPAVINCTCIDWFHEWPQEALISVSMRFLNELDVVPELIKPSISQVVSMFCMPLKIQGNMSMLFLRLPV